MRRQICWKEKTEEGKTEIRVTLNKHEIKWQYKPKDGSWDYDTPPTPEQWDRLEEELNNRYQRGHTSALEALQWIAKAREER